MSHYHQSHNNNNNQNGHPHHQVVVVAATDNNKNNDDDPTAQFWWTLVNQPVQIQFATTSTSTSTSSSSATPKQQQPTTPSRTITQQGQQQPPVAASPIVQQQQKQQQQVKELQAITAMTTKASTTNAITSPWIHVMNCLPTTSANNNNPLDPLQEPRLLQYHHHQQQQQQPALIDTMSTLTASLDNTEDSVTTSHDDDADEDDRGEAQAAAVVEEEEEEDRYHVGRWHRRKQQRQQQQQRQQRKLWISSSPQEAGGEGDFFEVAMEDSLSSASSSSTTTTTPTTVHPSQHGNSPSNNNNNTSLVKSSLHDASRNDSIQTKSQQHCSGVVAGPLMQGEHDDNDKQLEASAADGPNISRYEQTTVSAALLKQPNVDAHQEGTSANPLQQRQTPWKRAAVTVTATTTPDKPTSMLELQLVTTFDEAMQDVALLLDQPITSSPPSHAAMFHQSNHAASATTSGSSGSGSIKNHKDLPVLSDKAYQEAIQRAEIEVEKALQQYRNSQQQQESKHIDTTKKHFRSSNNNNNVSELSSPPHPHTVDTTTTNTTMSSNRRPHAIINATTTTSPTKATSSASSNTRTPTTTKASNTTTSSITLDRTHHQDDEATAPNLSPFSSPLTSNSNRNPSLAILLDARQHQQLHSHELTPRCAEMELKYQEQLDQLRLQNKDELSTARASYEQETERIRQEYERNFSNQIYRLEMVKERQMAFLQERYQQQLEEGKHKARQQMQIMKQELKMKLVDLCRDTFEREKKQAVEEAVEDLTRQVQEARDHVSLLEQERLSLLEEMDRSQRQTKLQHEMDLDMVKRKVREHVEELKSLQYLELQSIHMEKDEAIVLATKSATEFAHVGRELVHQLKRKLDLTQQKVRLLLKEKEEVAEENDLVVAAMRHEYDTMQRHYLEQMTRMEQRFLQQQQKQYPCSCGSPEHDAGASSRRQQQQHDDDDGLLNLCFSEESQQDLVIRSAAAAVAGTTPSPALALALLENEKIRAEKDAALQLLNMERSKRSQLVSMLTQRSQQANNLLDHLLQSHESAVMVATTTTTAASSVTQQQGDSNIVIPTDQQQHQQQDHDSGSTDELKSTLVVVDPQPIADSTSEPVTLGGTIPMISTHRPSEIDEKSSSLRKPTSAITTKQAPMKSLESSQKVSVTTTNPRITSTGVAKRGRTRQQPHHHSLHYSSGILGAAPKLTISTSHTRHSKGNSAAAATQGSGARRQAGTSSHTGNDERRRGVKATTSTQLTGKTLAVATMSSHETTPNSLIPSREEQRPLTVDNESHATTDTAKEGEVEHNVFRGNESTRQNTPINRSSLMAQERLDNETAKTETDSRYLSSNSPPLSPTENYGGMGGSQPATAREQDVLKTLQPSTADTRVPAPNPSPSSKLIPPFENAARLEDLSNEIIRDLLPGNSSDTDGVDDPFNRNGDDEIAIDADSWESAFVRKPLSVKRRVALYEYLKSISSNTSSETSSTAASTTQSNRKTKSSFSMQSNQSTLAGTPDQEGTAVRFFDV